MVWESAYIVLRFAHWLFSYPVSNAIGHGWTALFLDRDDPFCGVVAPILIGSFCAKEVALLAQRDTSSLNEFATTALSHAKIQKFWSVAM